MRRLRDWAAVTERGVPRAACGAAIGPLQTEEALCLVGDLHGCGALLERLLQRRAAGFPDHRLVVLGDMIDRGGDSAAVLRRLAQVPGAVCLARNHEAMLLDALADPEQRSAAWLASGGLMTLASFGLHGLPGDLASLCALMGRFRRSLGTELADWLGDRPLRWQSGNLVMSHAGLDPSLPLDDQSRRDLLWGHPEALSRLRRDGLHVAHGHYVVAQARQAGGRIALDTGAYATGVLSYALVEPGGPAGGRVEIGTIR